MEPKEVKRSPASAIWLLAILDGHETRTGEHGQQARQAAGTIDSAQVLSGEVVPRLDHSRKPHNSADMHHHVSYASH